VATRVKLAKPFFSIVIPTYEPCVERLCQCIDLILGQTFNNLEIIVIDSYSDVSPKIRDLTKSNPKINYFQMDRKGVYAAMNYAVSVTRGDWILFLGSDDRLLNKNVLETVKKIIDSRRYLFLHQAYYGNVLLDGATVWGKDQEVYAGKFNITRLSMQNICHQAIFYRAHSARMNRIGYEPKYCVTADWDYNIRAWVKGGMGYLPLIVSVFRGGGISDTSTYDGFHGSQALNWNYWKSKEPLPLAFIWFIYCRLCRKLRSII
jgi:glycosyltransferase involved in cell wall biosynthesis